jgi:threonine/homoserine/homoserine lactone efflux protein
MSSEELAALLSFVTAMSFTPGPNTALSTALAANGGLRRAMPFVLAVPVGWCLLLLLGAFGLGALVTAIPALRWLIKGVGVGYMLWMAWLLFGRRDMAHADPARLNVGFAQGVALQFVNIKAWMNALAVSATWIAVEGQLVGRLLQVLPLMMAYGFLSNFSYALTGSLLRGWLAQGHRLLVFNRALAVVLVITAVWLLGA